MTKPPVILKPGVVFWPKGLPHQKDIHPWIVISVPVDGTILLANFTDAENNPEETCCFKVGDHECLTLTSILEFSDKSVQPSKKMAHIIWEARLVTHYPDLSPELLERVMREARKTVDMSERVKIRYGIIKPPAKGAVPF